MKDLFEELSLSTLKKLYNRSSPYKSDFSSDFIIGRDSYGACLFLTSRDSELFKLGLIDIVKINYNPTYPEKTEIEILKSRNYAQDYYYWDNSGGIAGWSTLCQGALRRNHKGEIETFVDGNWEVMVPLNKENWAKEYHSAEELSKLLDIQEPFKGEEVLTDKQSNTTGTTPTPTNFWNKVAQTAYDGEVLTYDGSKWEAVKVVKESEVMKEDIQKLQNDINDIKHSKIFKLENELIQLKNDAYFEKSENFSNPVARQFELTNVKNELQDFKNTIYSDIQKSLDKVGKAASVLEGNKDSLNDILKQVELLNMVNKDKIKELSKNLDSFKQDRERYPEDVYYIKSKPTGVVAKIKYDNQSDYDVNWSNVNVSSKLYKDFGIDLIHFFTDEDYCLSTKEEYDIIAKVNEFSKIIVEENKKDQDQSVDKKSKAAGTVSFLEYWKTISLVDHLGDKKDNKEIVDILNDILFSLNKDEEVVYKYDEINNSLNFQKTFKTDLNQFSILKIIDEKGNYQSINDLPGVVARDFENNTTIYEWYKDGDLHRVGKFGGITTNEIGDVVKGEYFCNGFSLDIDFESAFLKNRDAKFITEHLMKLVTPNVRITFAQDGSKLKVAKYEQIGSEDFPASFGNINILNTTDVNGKNRSIFYPEPRSLNPLPYNINVSNTEKGDLEYRCSYEYNLNQNYPNFKTIEIYDDIAKGFKIKSVIDHDQIEKNLAEYNNGVSLQKSESDSSISKSKFLTTVKNSGQAALYRIASNQITKAVKVSLITLLSKQFNDNGKLTSVIEFLDSPYGEALLSLTIGIALPNLDLVKADPRLQTLTHEFRTEGLATLGNEVIEGIINTILPSITESLKSLPEQQIRVSNVAPEAKEDLAIDIEFEDTIKEQYNESI